MRVLVVKTSSMGDVIHTLPALTDATRAIPGIRFDWVVEESFSEIPSWHPAVDEVIPVAIRRWRKTPVKSLLGSQWKQCKAMLRQQPYDCVIDAQGLIKSALLTRYVKAPRYGFDRQSIREPLAALAYHYHISVAKNMHAVERTRSLFSQSLGYDVPENKGDYHLDKTHFKTLDKKKPYVVFLHGTTRFSKYWPEGYWQALSKKVCDAGFTVTLPWSNEEEKKRAELIASSCACAEVLPKLNLHGIACVIAQASGVVAVDTGLGHLSAALDIPGVSLYGSTRPLLVGAYGQQQIHLNASEMQSDAGDKNIEPKEMANLTPAIVWERLQQLLDNAETVQRVDA